MLKLDIGGAGRNVTDITVRSFSSFRARERRRRRGRLQRRRGGMLQLGLETPPWWTGSKAFLVRGSQTAQGCLPVPCDVAPGALAARLCREILPLLIAFCRLAGYHVPARSERYKSKTAGSSASAGLGPTRCNRQG